MSMNDLHKAIRLVKKKGSGDFEGSKPLTLVQSAEKRLGAKFPPTYREFLLRLGCGDIGGREFYGIINENFDNSSIPNAIWLTLDERKISNLDPKLILISDSLEGYYALDTSHINESGECPVVDWIPNVPKTELEIVAPDFGKFFLDLIQEVMQDEN